MKVSVITVCYNPGVLLEPTILSVLGQDYANMEYIIIDGGSRDGTLSIIEKYRAQLAFAVSEPDGGIYDAMNKGLAHATGQWVNFMNAGDAFADAGVLKRVFGNGIIPDAVKLLGGNTINFFPDGQEDIHHAEGGDVLRHHLPFSHQASFTRINDANFQWKFDIGFHYAADFDLFTRIYWQFGASAIRTLDMPIARYRQEGSTTFANLRRVQREYLRIRARHRDSRWWRDAVKWLLRY